MALYGSNNEEKIFNYLKSKIPNAYGVCGLMGNLFAESGLRPNNLQNTYEKSLNFTDEAYTNAVNNGTYTNFVNDKAGFGLAQWTYYSRKQNLIDYARSLNISISDLEMQLDFLYNELKNDFKKVFNTLNTATSVLEASNCVLLDFEAPANHGSDVQALRCSYGLNYYNKYIDNASGKVAIGGTSIMDIKQYLTSYNHTNSTTDRIKYIVIHYVGALGGALANCQYYAEGNKNASAHYYVGFDGEIYQSVLDENVAWHCGAKSYVHAECRNANSIGIEMCVRKRDTSNLGDTDKDWYFEDKTVASAIELTKYLMQKYNVSADRVIRHYDVTGKICPNPYVYNTGTHTWAEFKNAISGESVISSIATSNSANSASANAITSANGTVKVIYNGSDGLNVRTAPSMGASVEVVVKSGESFTVIGISDDKKWYKLKSGLYITTNTKYVVFNGTVGNPQYTVTVTADVLNVRDGAGVNYDINTQIKEHEVYTIVEEKNGWGKLLSGAGWINLSYTKKN